MFVVSTASNIFYFSVYWENSNNTNKIPASKWKPLSSHFEMGAPTPSATTGCVIAEVYMKERYIVETRLRKLSDCSAAAGVKNFMCEKKDIDDPGRMLLC